MIIKKRKVPIFKSNKEAEKFLESDLSDIDWSDFKPIKFEFSDKKTKQKDKNNGRK